MNDAGRRAPGEGTFEWSPKGVAARRDAWLSERSGTAFDDANLTGLDHLDRWLEDSVRQSRTPTTD
jgi:hypothetical protein